MKKLVILAVSMTVVLTLPCCVESNKRPPKGIVVEAIEHYLDPGHSFMKIEELRYSNRNRGILRVRTISVAKDTHGNEEYLYQEFEFGKVRAGSGKDKWGYNKTSQILSSKEPLVKAVFMRLLREG